MVLMSVDLPKPVWPVDAVSFPIGHGLSGQYWATASAARAPLTNANNVELESTLQQLALNLRRDAVETDMAARRDGRWGRHFD